MSPRGALVCGLALALAACFQPQDDVGADDLCRSVGYSISSRTLSCTGDPDLANLRYEQFSAELACLYDPGLADYQKRAWFRCASEVGSLPCDQVLAAGDHFEGLLAPFDDCDGHYARTAGVGSGGFGGTGGSTDAGGADSPAGDAADAGGQ